METIQRFNNHSNQKYLSNSFPQLYEYIEQFKAKL